MNWNFERDDSSDQIKVGILVSSDFLRRGLRQTLTDDLPHAVESRILTSSTAMGDIKAGRLDALILDTCHAYKLADVLGENDQRPRIILLSSRLHAGIKLPLPKDRICFFHSACSSQWKWNQFLEVVLACRPGAVERGDCDQCPIRHSLHPRNLQLSKRETEVLRLIGLLHTNKEIGKELGISVKTVEAHSANIQRKLKLRNSRELLQKAVRWVDGF